jgi:hypothetical protein
MHRYAPQEFAPGNYYFFELFLEIEINRVTRLGYPKQAIRDGHNPSFNSVEQSTEVILAKPSDTSGAMDRRAYKGLVRTNHYVSRGRARG